LEFPPACCVSVLVGLRCYLCAQQVGVEAGEVVSGMCRGFGGGVVSWWCVGGVPGCADFRGFTLVSGCARSALIPSKGISSPPHVFGETPPFRADGVQRHQRLHGPAHASRAPATAHPAKDPLIVPAPLRCTPSPSISRTSADSPTQGLQQRQEGHVLFEGRPPQAGAHKRRRAASSYQKPAGIGHHRPIHRREPDFTGATGALASSGLGATVAAGQRAKARRQLVAATSGARRRALSLKPMLIQECHCGSWPAQVRRVQPPPLGRRGTPAARVLRPRTLLRL